MTRRPPDPAERTPDSAERPPDPVERPSDSTDSECGTSLGGERGISFSGERGIPLGDGRGISFGDERGTSPAIGAVLLVGITVLLATTAGTQLMGLAQSQQGSFATATVEYAPADDSVTVTWVANANADELRVKIRVGDRQRTVALDAVGDTLVVDADGVTVSRGTVVEWKRPAVADGDRVSVTVVAVTGGESMVVAERAATI